MCGERNVVVKDLDTLISSPSYSNIYAGIDMWEKTLSVYADDATYIGDHNVQVLYSL